LQFLILSKINLFLLKYASNNQISLLRKLNQRKHRVKEQLFLAEGERTIEQILVNGLIDVVDIFIKPSRLDRFANLHKKMHLVEKAVFDEISDTESPQGIVAICRMPDECSCNKISPKNGLLVATDSIQDPGNLGTIIRTAVWYGAVGLILGAGSVDVYNPKVVRSTAGATGVLPVCSGNLIDILPTLEKDGWQTLLLDASEGATSIHKQPKHAKIILVAGNEANGINPALIHPARKRVLLPASTPQQFVESLNAGVAMSIALAVVHN
jgi:TrmH family RNA methyltransferase